MNDLPFGLIEALASVEAQRRYIIDATVDEYLVPDELLNDAWHFCERAERADMVASITSEQREAVQRLKSAVQSLGDCTQLYDRSNIADLVERDKGWAVIRDRAGKALSSFGRVYLG